MNYAAVVVLAYLYYNNKHLLTLLALISVLYHSAFGSGSLSVLRATIFALLDGDLEGVLLWHVHCQ